MNRKIGAFFADFLVSYIIKRPVRMRRLRGCSAPRGKIEHCSIQPSALAVLAKPREGAAEHGKSPEFRAVPRCRQSKRHIVKRPSLLHVGRTRNSRQDSVWFSARVRENRIQTRENAKCIQMRTDRTSSSKM